MKRACLMIGAVVVMVSAVSTVAVGAEPEDQAKTPEAQIYYEKLVDIYMHFEPKAWDEAYKSSYKYSRDFSLKQKQDVIYMNRSAKEYRPDWWKYTKSSTNISFPITMWGKRFVANYMPTEMLGAQTFMWNEKTQQYEIVVTWQPHVVDSPKPLGGDAAEAHQLREGDEAEGIVWHELGHNYIASGFSNQQLGELYTNYSILFHSLQEFFADMTALYYCSPPGRKSIMLLRIEEINWNDVNDPHARGALGIGAYILATVLMNPEKWPSFHLPTMVPDGDTERKTILYMYEHLDPHYSLEEDRQLRDLIGDLIKQQGSAIFRSKGTVPLPNKLEYKITTSEDRDLQIKRNQWVADTLKKAIEAGMVKKVLKTDGHPKRFRISVPW